LDLHVVHSVLQLHYIWISLDKVLDVSTKRLSPLILLPVILLQFV
jgi:hypothetical protein